MTHQAIEDNRTLLWGPAKFPQRPTTARVRAVVDHLVQHLRRNPVPTFKR